MKKFSEIIVGIIAVAFVAIVIAMYYFVVSGLIASDLPAWVKFLLIFRR